MYIYVYIDAREQKRGEDRHRSSMAGLSFSCESEGVLAVRSAAQQTCNIHIDIYMYISIYICMCI